MTRKERKEKLRLIKKIVKRIKNSLDINDLRIRPVFRDFGGNYDIAVVKTGFGIEIFSNYFIFFKERKARLIEIYYSCESGKKLRIEIFGETLTTEENTKIISSIIEKFEPEIDHFFTDGTGYVFCEDDQTTEFDQAVELYKGSIRRFLSKLSENQ